MRKHKIQAARILLKSTEAQLAERLDDAGLDRLADDVDSNNPRHIAHMRQIPGPLPILMAGIAGYFFGAEDADPDGMG